MPSPSVSASEAPDLLLLIDCIEQAESAGVPYPDGATRLEEMWTCPGKLSKTGECDEPLERIYTIAHGRYQITERALHRWYPGVDSSWLHEPGRAKSILLGILSKLRNWFPNGDAKRIYYAYTAGERAKPYRLKRKAELAARVAACHDDRKRRVAVR